MAIVEPKISNSRMRSYGLVLLLAFAASVFGVTILDKFRERRLFGLLIKDKDREQVSLHLLLQKERDSNRGMKRKLDDIKAKVVALRNQKMELAGKLAEMQSMVASLKQEQKALESALEERNNKIKTLIKKETSTQNGSHLVKAVTELLRQKEDTIEKLKRRLQNPTKVWSASTDDPSNPHVNVTVTDNSLINVDDTVNENGGSQDWQSENIMVGDHLKRRDENDDKYVLEDKDKGGTSGEGRLAKFADLRVHGSRGRGARKSTGEGEEREKFMKDKQVDMVESSRNGIGLKMNDESGGTEAMQAKDQGVSRDRWPEELEVSRYDEAEETSMSLNERKNMEMFQHSENVAGSRVRGDHGFRNKFGKKRRRAISKGRELDKGQSSREIVNLSRKSEGHKKNVTEDEKKRVPLREEKEKIKIESLDGLKRDDHETVSDDNQPKMPENSKDSDSSEGNRQVEISDEGQMDLPENSTGQALEMRAGKEVIKDAEGNKKEADSSIDQLGVHNNSQTGIARTMEGNEHEVSEDNGDDLRAKRENDVKIKMEDESKAISNDGQSEITKNSQDGRRDNGKNELDGDEKSSILRNEQTQSTHEIESLQSENGEF
ncbi:hypothetical protein AAC387_Pa07g0644 [Persea americana]